MLVVSSSKKDIIVTTPKSEIENAKKEADNCIKNNGGYYFRRLNSKPKHIDIGSKIFYVEDGYVRGYGVISEIKNSKKECSTTGKQYEEGIYVTFLAASWKWIKPISMKGFQGWKYFDSSVKFEVIGDWKSDKP